MANRERISKHSNGAGRKDYMKVYMREYRKKHREKVAAIDKKYQQKKRMEKLNEVQNCESTKGNVLAGTTEPGNEGMGTPNVSND